MRLVIQILVLCLAQWAIIPNVLGHDMPKSFLSVRIQADHWELDARIPEDRLKVAFEHINLPTTNTIPAIEQAKLEDYIQQRVRVQSNDNTDWALKIEEIIPPTPSLDEWRVTIRATPPNGAPTPERAWLTYEVIGREVATHSVIVSLIQDWSSAVLPFDPILLGELRADVHRVEIIRHPDQETQAWFTLFTMGINHILHGPDHLLFLLLVMIASIFVHQEGTWQRYHSTRIVFGRMAWAVSAFTVGHLISLFMVSIGWLPAGGPRIEIAIASTIAFSAFCLLYPLQKTNRPWVALVFGLIHGVGFAEALSELQLPVNQLLTAVLSFNIGVEMVQLALGLLILGLYHVLKRAKAFDLSRPTMAIIGLTASAWWIIERVQVLLASH